MRYYFSFLIATLLFISSGCEEIGCSDVFLGEFTIDSSTAAYFPYEENKSLIFKNQNDEEITFTNINWVEESNSIVSFFTCNDETRNIIYTGDIGSYRFQNDLFDIVMNYTMGFVEEGDPKEQNIVDLITFTLVHPVEGFYSTLSIVSHSRGVTDFSHLEDFETFSNLGLNGSFFSEGIRSSVDNPENLVDLYVTATGGVIGFTDVDDNTWTFDRLE
ncbi:MAG: hypothetical protein AAF502_00715 [Bacteroidota bacterium]